MCFIAALLLCDTCHSYELDGAILGQVSPIFVTIEMVMFYLPPRFLHIPLPFIHNPG